MAKTKLTNKSKNTIIVASILLIFSFLGAWMKGCFSKPETLQQGAVNNKDVSITTQNNAGGDIVYITNNYNGTKQRHVQEQALRDSVNKFNNIKYYKIGYNMADMESKILALEIADKLKAMKYAIVETGGFLLIDDKMPEGDIQFSKQDDILYIMVNGQLPVN